MKHSTVIVVLLAWCILGALSAGCLDNHAPGAGVNQSEAAIVLALNDSVVREQIPVETGEYEIVEVGPEFCLQTGPGRAPSRICTAVSFRTSGQRSIYHVIIDDADGTIIGRYWQWVKEPMPCSGGGPPAEYSTIEEASAALAQGCPLAAPSAIPAGCNLSLIRVYGDPCPRRDIVYTCAGDELRLVQVCEGQPPYAFAITGKGVDEVVVRGSPGEFVEGIGENQLAWADANGSYWLLGNLQEEELLAIASSVRSVL